MPSSPQRQGFALVIALSLMAFVLLLLLSLSSLVRVESRSAKISQSTLAARQNALLGLQEALGELQKHAGPDQRVTATGSLWGNPSTGTQHLMGIWSSVDDNLDGLPDGSFQRWMLSQQDSANAKDINLVNQGLPIAFVGNQYISTLADHVVLVGSGSARHDLNQPNVMQGVVAQKKPINSDSIQSSGNYAWWVGDEGVKARINQQNTQTEPSFASQCAQRASIELMDGYAAVDGTSSQIPKILTTLSASQLGGATASAPKQHFHDATMHSLALQTDTRNGGLKQDLSLLFEMSEADYEALDPAEYSAYVNPVTPIDSVVNVRKGLLFRDQGIYGPTMDLLRNHYRQYKELTGPTSNPEMLARASYPNKTEFDIGSEGDPGYESMWRRTACIQAWHWGLWTDPGTSDRIQPVWWGEGDFPMPRLLMGNQTPYLNRVVFYISVQSEQDGGETTVADPSDDTFKLVLKFQPMLYVHNPYNLKMRVEGMRYLRNLGQDELWISKDGAAAEKIDLSTLLDSNNEATTLTSGDRAGDAQFVVSGAVTFEPGEVKIFVPLGAQNWGASMQMEELGNAFQPDSMALTLDLDQVLGQVAAVEKMTNIPRGTEIRISARWTEFAKQDFEIHEPSRGGFNTVWSALSQWRPTYSTGAITSNGSANAMNAPAYLIESLQTITPVIVDDYFIKPLKFTRSDTNSIVSGYPSFVLGNPLCASNSNVMGINSDSGRSPGGAILSTMTHSHMDYGKSGYPYFIDTISGSHSTWGSSNGSAGERYTTALEIPTAPMFSLGALQHANIAVEGYQPALAIGNSFPNPTMSDHSLVVEPIYGQQNYDLSYMANRALWDRYYFSSITPRVDDPSYDSNSADPKDDIKAVVLGFLNGDHSLGNTRMELIGEQVAPAQTLADLQNYKLSAAHLAVTGGFNINSTSVTAWKSFLSGYRDAALRYQGGSDDNAGVSAFPRMTYPNRAGEQDPVAESDDAWLGYAQLLDEEIEDLAEAIVAENKARALQRAGAEAVTPALTMGQFVNRMLEGNDSQQMKGTLQAAIETSGLNQSLDSYAGDFIANSYGAHSDEVSFQQDGRKLKVALSGSAPTSILQSDILQVLGSAMTPRSDTFTIRAYGETLGIQGEVSARVWCEAVVQRVTQPVHPDVSNPWEPEVKNSGEVDFGRAFKIVSFRWIGEGDV
jgi:hypothetical protein